MQKRDFEKCMAKRPATKIYFGTLVAGNQFGKQLDLQMFRSEVKGENKTAENLNEFFAFELTFNERETEELRQMR